MRSCRTTYFDGQRQPLTRWHLTTGSWACCVAGVSVSEPATGRAWHGSTELARGEPRRIRALASVRQLRKATRGLALTAVNRSRQIRTVARRGPPQRLLLLNSATPTRREVHRAALRDSSPRRGLLRERLTRLLLSRPKGPLPTTRWASLDAADRTPALPTTAGRWPPTRPISRPGPEPSTGPHRSYPDGTHTR